MKNSVMHIGIIPARYASSRFPGKPLVDIHGKSMIQRVYEQCVKSHLDRVVVATDDERIIEHVQDFGGEVVRTASTHISGTDRIAEAAKKLNLDNESIVVNIQGEDTTEGCVAVLVCGIYAPVVGSVCEVYASV